MVYRSLFGITLPRKVFGGSNWVGLKHFIYFFNSPQCGSLIENTLKLSVYSLLWGFPFPIIFAILLNEVAGVKLRRTFQTVAYAPYFISTVVLVSMMNVFLATDGGLINQILVNTDSSTINFLGRKEYFRSIFVVSGIWQSLGWSSIIYVAALSGVDPQMHEAAQIDGANRLHRIWHIDIPSIVPTAIILFILNCGQIMSLSYEKVYLMQNSLNLSVSEIITTYVYKMGIKNIQFSYTTAIGLFNNIINVILLLIVNTAAKKISDISLF